MVSIEQRQLPKSSDDDDLEILKVVQYRASLTSEGVEDLRGEVFQREQGDEGSSGGEQQQQGVLLSRPGAFKGAPGRSFSRTKSPRRSLLGKEFKGGRSSIARSLLMDESMKSRSMDESMKSSRCMDDVSKKSRSMDDVSTKSHHTASTTSCSSSSRDCCNVLLAKPMDVTIAAPPEPPAAVMVEAKLVVDDGVEGDPTMSRNSLKKIIAQLEQRLQNAPIAEVVSSRDDCNKKRSSWTKNLKTSASDVKKMLKRSTSMGDKKELVKKILKRRASMGDSCEDHMSSMPKTASMDKLMFWRKK